MRLRKDLRGRRKEISREVVFKGFKCYYSFSDQWKVFLAVLGRGGSREKREHGILGGVGQDIERNRILFTSGKDKIKMRRLLGMPESLRW